jgi:hypothetical protein
MDKPTMLLGLAFFLASAPNPDSQAVAEITANFIVPERSHVLEASETTASPQELMASALRQASPADGRAQSEAANRPEPRDAS